MLRKTICLLVFLLAGRAVYARDFPESILFKDFATQYHYRDSLFGSVNSNDSAKALQLFRDLGSWAERMDDLPLKLGAEVSKYRYLAEQNSLTDSLSFETGITSLIAELIANKLPYLEAEGLSAATNYYWFTKRYEPAFEYSIRAYNKYINFTQEEFPARADYIAAFGGKYYHFRDYNTAKDYHLQACASNNYASITMINTLALCYINIAKYDSAEYFFNKAYALAVSKRDTQWQGLLDGNRGLMYYRAGKPDQAMPYLQHELQINLMLGKGNKKNAVTTIAMIGDILLTQHDIKGAMSYALQAYNIMLEYHLTGLDDARMNVYPSIARAYAANGRPDLAYSFLDSAMSARDSISKRASQLVLSGVQHHLDAERHLTEELRFNQEQRIHRLTLYSLVAGIVLMLMIGVLLINRQRLNYRHRRRQLEAEKQHAVSELENASAQLTAFTQIITEKNDLIEKLAAELARLSKAGVATFDTRTLRHLQDSTILTDKEWENFQTIFEKAHKGFIKRLQFKVPGLSPIDTRFMLLSKLRLSGNEMSSILGISKEAVKQNRERLRSKLNLPDDELVLENFADVI